MSRPLNEFDTPTTNQEERLFLLILETEIGSHKLDSFIKTEGEWEGDIADSSLYRKKQAFEEVMPNFRNMIYEFYVQVLVTTGPLIHCLGVLYMSKVI